MTIDNDAFYQGIKANISQHKRHLMVVFPCRGDDNLPFIYTIGNHELGLPELFVIGNAGGGMAHLINNLCDQMIERGKAFDDGELVYWQPREPHMQPCKVIRCSPSVKDDYTVQAGRYYDHEDYAVMQVVISDERGRFPGDPDCDEPWSTAPVYGLN